MSCLFLCHVLPLLFYAKLKGINNNASNNNKGEQQQQQQGHIALGCVVVAVEAALIKIARAADAASGSERKVGRGAFPGKCSKYTG